MSSFAQAQSVERNRITFSAGWMQQLFGYSFERETAPVLGLSYGYRPLKFVEFEAGVDVSLHPRAELCTQSFCYQPGDRYIRVPFGVRFIAPLVARRVELSLGGGGMVQKYSVSNPYSPFGVVSRYNWGGYFLGGAAVAIDHRRRFWVSVTPRLILANTPHTVNRFLIITGDLSFRF